MALNVEQIENRLAMMQDAELQKYAAMNKNDPYIMALAVSESNRRKKVRQAQQGMQGQMTQPKVVDAAVQGMAAPMPEDQGIARLSAGPMNFADGGIVAFADGGGVERYNGTMGSLTGGLYAEDPLLSRLAKTNALRPLAMAGAVPASVLLEGATYSKEAADYLASLTPEQRREFYKNPMVSALSGDTGLAAAILNAPDMQPSTMPYSEQMKRALGMLVGYQSPETRADRYKEEKQAEATKRIEAFKDKTAGTPYTSRVDAQFPRGAAAVPSAAEQMATLNRPAAGSDTTQRGPGAGPGTSAAPGAGVGTNTSDLQALYKKLQGPVDKELTELRNQRELFSTALQDFAKKEQTAFETEEAKRGDVFKGRQERIAQQEAKLEGMKDQGLGLALLQAGAAMMSTPGGLGVALGKGVDVGTKQYVAGIDKLNAAQDRLMDAKDRLEELRVNREDMTAKERRALASQVNRSVLEGKKLFLDGAEKDLGYRREDAKTLFSGIVTDLASQRSAGATVEAARIRSQDTKDYLEAVRGGSMVETARKNIMSEIIKANPHADEPTRQRLFQAEWAKALQNNPALAQYAGGASGGGGASSSDPLGLR